MTADDRLRLIRIKIERAEKHLDDLEPAVRSLGEATFNAMRFGSSRLPPGSGWDYVRRNSP